MLDREYGEYSETIICAYVFLVKYNAEKSSESYKASYIVQYLHTWNSLHPIATHITF